jgi:hypothetical protein
VSDCSVCIGGGYGSEYDEYYSSDEVAASDLTCCECNEKIPAGSKYEDATGEMDGVEYNHTTCLSCVEIAEVFSCNKVRMHCQLWDSMHDYAFPELTTGTDCFRKLSVANRTRVIEKWQAWKGLR